MIKLYTLFALLAIGSSAFGWEYEQGKIYSDKSEVKIEDVVRFTLVKAISKIGNVVEIANKTIFTSDLPQAQSIFLKFLDEDGFLVDVSQVGHIVGGAAVHELDGMRKMSSEDFRRVQDVVIYIGLDPK